MEDWVGEPLLEASVQTRYMYRHVSGLAVSFSRVREATLHINKLYIEISSIFRHLNQTRPAYDKLQQFRFGVRLSQHTAKLGFHGFRLVHQS